MGQNAAHFPLHWDKMGKNAAYISREDYDSLCIIAPSTDKKNTFFSFFTITYPAKVINLNF